MEKQQWNLKPFHAEVLKIFREFERICEKYHLRYYADGGTAIGAVRHQGFIPWDDDFDVDMPRDDYNKLVAVIRDELPPHLQFKRGGESKDAPIHFSKIVNVESGLMERMSKETNIDFDFSPFIDIFVLEGVPDLVPDIKRWWHGRRLLRLCQMYRYPDSCTCSGNKNSPKFLACRLVGFFVSWFVRRTKDNEDMMCVLDEYASKQSFDNSFMVVEPAFFRMRIKYIMPRSYYEPAKELPFEDGFIKVPARVDLYLYRYFGDYMKLPPEEYRIPEHAMKRAYNHV